MDKVIQIANICEITCNVPNPMPGRIYYAKGISPALNTCGGGVENADVLMDKIKIIYPPPSITLSSWAHERPRPQRRDRIIPC